MRHELILQARLRPARCAAPRPADRRSCPRRDCFSAHQHPWCSRSPPVPSLLPLRVSSGCFWANPSAVAPWSPPQTRPLRVRVSRCPQLRARWQLLQGSNPTRGTTLRGYGVPRRLPKFPARRRKLLWGRGRPELSAHPRQLSLPRHRCPLISSGLVLRRRPCVPGIARAMPQPFAECRRHFSPSLHPAPYSASSLVCRPPCA